MLKFGGNQSFPQKVINETSCKVTFGTPFIFKKHTQYFKVKSPGLFIYKIRNIIESKVLK